MVFKRRTKIIATLGPASEKERIIEEMIKAGVDIFRLNFSHGDYSQHNLYIKRIRNAEKKVKRNIKVLVDLQGNKIRLHKNIKGKVKIKEGQYINILKAPSNKDRKKLYLTLNFDIPFEETKKGSSIFIDDAKVKLVIEKVTKDVILAKVVYGEEIGDEKGVHFPDLDIQFSRLSEDDEKAVLWSLENNIDYIAQSFVQDENDIRRIKEIIGKNDKKIKLIAKIENKTPLSNLDKIFKVSDGVMVARGDLGVSMTLAKVPIIQKKIAKLGNFYNKTTIIATQLLDSMVERDMPTRAEASDISNAVFEGNEMLLVSNETAVGKHPLKVIEELLKIIIETEKAIESGELT